MRSTVAMDSSFSSPTSSPTQGVAGEMDSSSLLSIQSEMAGIFAELADIFGNPSSLGSIYGFLFASPEPLSMEQIVSGLGISTGSVSQGLRRLVELEAIIPHKPNGERLTRYTAKLELRPFVAMFLDQQLQPRLQRSVDRITTLREKIPDLSPPTRDLLGARIDRAAKWHARAKTFLPMIRRFLR
jgi:DNA-binding transcriptional regulator GbsR (MarR family)